MNGDQPLLTQTALSGLASICGVLLGVVQDRVEDKFGYRFTKLHGINNYIRSGKLISWNLVHAGFQGMFFGSTSSTFYSIYWM